MFYRQANRCHEFVYNLLLLYPIADDGVTIHGRPPVLHVWRAHCLSPVTALALWPHAACADGTVADPNTSPSIASPVYDGIETPSEPLNEPLHEQAVGHATNGKCTPPVSADVDFIVSCSTDCRARIWSASGVYIGTFGQEKEWDLDDEATWKNSSLPAEIQDRDAHEQREKVCGSDAL